MNNNKNEKIQINATPKRPGGPGGFNFPVEKAKNFKASAKRLISELSKIKKELIFVFILTILSVILAVITPKITAKASTAMLDAIKPMFIGLPSLLAEKLPYIAQILLTCTALYLLSAAFSAISTYIMSGATYKIVYSLRKRLRSKINRLPLKYFDEHGTGDVLSRLTNDIDNIQSGIGQSVIQIISAILTVIGVVIMMFSINVWLTLITLGILPLSFFITSFIIKKSQNYFVSQQKNLGELNTQIEETYNAHLIVKAYDACDRELEKFAKTNNKLYEVSQKAQFFSGIMYPLINFINNFSYVLISIVCCIFILNGHLEFGYLTSFLIYSRQFTQPMGQIAQILNVLQSTVAGAERVFEVFDEPEIEPDTENALVLNSVSGDVDFKDIKFSYSENNPLMTDVNNSAKAGQIVAIVGPTGAGKTTIVNLLMRFYELQGGQILIDGHNITSLTRKSLRQNIGMVLQDTWLFKGTIAENIAYGKPDATEEEIEKAATIAQAHHFILTLPNGYSTQITEDAGNISQGQKQLVTIARALLTNPEILILDEATSSVDTRTEVLVQQAMNELMKGRTSFVIAHRLSTIMNADNILVMNKGDIVEQGTHEQLLTKNGFYASLYNSQF